MFHCNARVLATGPPLEESQRQLDSSNLKRISVDPQSKPLTVAQLHFLIPSQLSTHLPRHDSFAAARRPKLYLNDRPEDRRLHLLQSIERHQKTQRTTLLADDV